MGNQPVSLFSAIHALFATFTFRRPCYHLPFSATVASSPVSASSRLPSSLPENAHLPLSLAGSLTPYNNFEYEAQFKSRNVPPRPLSLQLEILTWEKDSHGLFDYEATKHVKEYFEIQGPCKVFRNWYRKPALMQKRRPASLRTTRSRRDSFPMRPSTSSPPSRCAIMATRKVKHELRKASCSTRPNGPRRRS